MSNIHSLTSRGLNRGFTLLEIMVAIIVTTVGVLGMYSLLIKIIALADSNTSRFMAAQLAKEGVELIRNIRDVNMLSGNSWDVGLTTCSGVGCEMDYNDNGLSVYAGRYLKIDSNGFYNYELGAVSRFRRKITIFPNGDILEIVSEVFWPGASGPSLKINEHLYNWRK